MGRAITKIYMGHGEYLRNHGRLAKAKGRVKMVRNQHMRKEAIKGEVIITTSGLLDGGPVLNYIGKVLKDRKSAIIMTGYQVEGTNGRMLMDDGLIEIDGEKVRPECEVDWVDLSAHAGHSELVDFARKCDPERIVLMHGDNRKLLADDLAKDFEVIMPDNGELLHL